jgi:hypothetical protein
MFDKAPESFTLSERGTFDGLHAANILLIGEPLPCHRAIAYGEPPWGDLVDFEWTLRQAHGFTPMGTATANTHSDGARGAAHGTALGRAPLAGMYRLD